MSTTYYGRGKLLLTGEYTVLDGAAALAVPTRFGQYLHVRETGDDHLSWMSLDHTGQSWLQLSWRPGEKAQVQFGEAKAGRRLSEILEVAERLRPGVHHELTGKEVKTQLEFDREWGLGSSSTLIHCLGQWLDIDPFDLLENTFGGSGYDLACAGARGAIVYQIESGAPSWTPVPLPEWTRDTFFVYRNQKQNSREGIRRYREHAGPEVATNRISTLTADLLKALLPAEVQKILREHERITSGLIGLPPVREVLFPDFPGQLKSLGAWGGDFVWGIAEHSSVDYRTYFREKGYATVLSWAEMVADIPAEQ